MTEAKKELGTQFGVNMSERSSAFLGALFEKFHFSFQQRKQLAEFASDFEAWDETPVYELLADGQCGLNFNKAKFNKTGKVPNGEQIFNFVREAWLELKSRPHSYTRRKNLKFPPFAQTASLWVAVRWRAKTRAAAIC